MSWHQTIIVGHLGGEPEMKYLQSGTAICNFSVAVSERWRDRQTNEQREKTTWYRIAVWGAQAEPCNTYLTKGSQVMVVGQVSANGYVNKNGEASASLELKANQVQFLSSGNSQTSQQSVAPQSDPKQYTGIGSSDDIPF